MIGSELNREEKLAYDFAVHWRDPAYCPDLTGLDWPRFASLLCNNRMGVLARQVFERVNPAIPQDAQKILEAQIEKYEHAAFLFEGALKSYLASAATHNIETLVLKGLWLSEKVYHEPALRPGSDIVT